MIKVYNKGTNELLGRISQGELDFLAEHLEEESRHDTDYYIRKETVEEFAQKGASTHLVDLLRGGLRGEDAIEIRWERDATSA